MNHMYSMDMYKTKIQKNGEKEVRPGMAHPFRSCMMAKLFSRSGESITETLAAVLIVSLASVLLVTMVMAGRRIISRSDEAYSGYISEHSALSAAGSDSSTADGGTVSDQEQKIVIKPSTDDADYSLPKISENVYLRESEDGNLTFFPADHG